MCIIIVKPYDVDLPSQAEIATCFEGNKDGFGLAFTEKDGKEVIIRKGALKLEMVYALLNTIKEPKNKQMLLHFRTATEGAICPGNCHPFPLSTDSGFLQNTFVKTKMAIAHNGVIIIPNDEKLVRNEKIPAGATLTWKDSKPGYITRVNQFVEYEWSPEDWAAHYNLAGGFANYSYRTGTTLKYSDTQVFIRDYLAPCKEFLMTKEMLNFIAQFVTGKFIFLTPETFYYMGYFYKDKDRLYSNEGYKPKFSPVTYVHHCTSKEERKELPVPKETKIKGDSKRPGLWLRCGMCEAFVIKQETNEYEDMILCDDCYKSVKGRKIDEPYVKGVASINDTNYDAYCGY